MKKEYDLLVIGAGPAGYVASIRAAQLGKKVALIEKNKIGGTCLNVGCVPSKAFIKSANAFLAVKKASSFGVNCTLEGVDLSKVRSRAEVIISTLRGSVQSLLSKYNIDVYNHEAALMGASIFSPLPGSIAIEEENGNVVTLVGKNILLCTGSRVKDIPGLEMDHKVILSSDDMPQLESIPESITILGGGVIGVEWAFVLSAFGSKVTLIEASSQLLPNEDAEVAKLLQSSLEKQGVVVYTNTTLNVAAIKKSSTAVEVQLISSQSEAPNADSWLSSSCLLVAVGRTPNTQNLGLHNTKVTLTKSGHIPVDEHFRTKEKHIFAVGDIIDFLPLAHAASAAAVYVVEYLYGLSPYPINKNNIPRCVYCTPEVASVGLTQTTAKAQGYTTKEVKFPYMANAKAYIEDETEGFVKIVQDAQTQDILGVHMVGSKATELISVPALAKFLNASGMELSKSVYPHPGVSEIFQEAAASLYEAAIHKH